MSWYRKYRPKKVSDLAIVPVREMFESMMQQGKIPQVMLFAGPRGTGKTSSARIIAGILNEKQNEKVIDHIFFAKAKPKELQLREADENNDLIKNIFAGNSFVVQEMDAASNRGIDDIRALKERLSLPPQDGKMAVYILDEAHMLTKEAFNALLKMLEETPPHVAFILATTELHKIPATVTSRCSIVHFRKANQTETVSVLKKIVTAEKLDAEDNALELIAKVADGSFRDAVKLLEMAASDDKKIIFATLQEKLTAIGESSVEELLTALLEKDEVQITALFSQLRGRNVDEKFLFKSILEHLHYQMLLGIAGGESKYPVKVCHFLLKELSNVDLSGNLPVPLLALELKFLELIFRSKEKNPVKPARNATHSVAGGKNPKMQKKNDIDLSTSQFESDSLKPVGKGDGQKLLLAWNNFLGVVEEKQAAIAMLLRSSKPLKAQDASLSIEVYYPFHKEKLEDMATRNLLKDCSLSFAGGNVDLEFILSQKPAVVLATEKKDENLIELAEELLV